MNRILISILMLAIGVLPFRAQQRLALKVNLLYAATTTPNLGVEYAFSPRMSAEIWGAYNLIDFRGDFSLRHYLAEVETRYWFDRPFSRHFVGAHALAGRFDVGGIPFIHALKHHHYRGTVYGGGLTYGYYHRLAGRWGIEASLGVGYALLKYDRYRCRGCAVMEARFKRHYWGPTRAAVSLVYRLGCPPAATAPSDARTAYEMSLRDRREADSLRLVLSRIEEQNERYRRALDSLHAGRDTLTASGNLRLESGRGVMYIQYPVNVTRVLPAFSTNRRELARIDSLLRPLLADTTVTVRSIRLTGYASPEGRYDHNVNLANRRIVGVMEYLSEVYDLPNHSVFNLKAVAEDWEGLEEMVIRRNPSWAVDALRIIREVPLFDGRELRLMEIGHGDPYRTMLKDWFPGLRRTEFVVEWERKKSEQP